MKLLVTGCAGFIGSHFCEIAMKAGHTVTGIDSLTYAGRKENISHLAIDAYENDICNILAMTDIIERVRPDAIVHLAAETHVSRSIDSREEFLRTNVMGTNALLEAALQHWQAHNTFLFLHVSTDEVYGSLGPDDKPWTEDSPYAPNNPYSASKAASDHLVRSYYKTYGLPVIITHSANNYGSRQHPEKLIPTLIRQCMNSEPMTLHGDGQQKRDWLHVEDNCRGLLAAIELGKVGETYNLGGGGACERTNLEIANLIAGQILDTCVGYVNIEDRPGNDRRYAMDATKAFNQLNWRNISELDIEDSIAKVVRWYLENPNYGDDYGS
jgi:dTDP-glucose 4,6-dehydratase